MLVGNTDLKIRNMYIMVKHFSKSVKIHSSSESIQILGLTRYSSTGLAKYSSTGLARYSCTGITRYSSTGLTRHTSTGVTRYTSTGLTRYTSTGLTGYSITGITGYYRYDQIVRSLAYCQETELRPRC